MIGMYVNNMLLNSQSEYREPTLQTANKKINNVYDTLNSYTCM